MLEGYIWLNEPPRAAVMGGASGIENVETVGAAVCGIAFEAERTPPVLRFARKDARLLLAICCKVVDGRLETQDTKKKRGICL